MKTTHTGVLLAAGTYLIWGLLPAFWKLLAHVPAVEVLCHRILWSFLLLLAVTLLVGSFGSVVSGFKDPRVLAAYLAAGVTIGINWLIYIWAVGAGFILETSLGYFINPLLSVLLGVIVLRERLRPGQWTAIALAGAGVVYLTFAYGSLPWIALGLAAAFSVYGLIKKIAPLGSLSGLTLETAALLAPACLYLLHLQNTGEAAFPGAGLLTGACLAGTGIVTVVPLLLFSSAARRIDLSLLGILQYIAPSISFVLGVFVYREPFTRSTLIGFCIVWVALIIYTVDGLLSRKGRPSAGAGGISA
ncbi:MAG: EamA family transporter RarD [Desulfomonilia bacterium]|jgi:chloramphenicol-sensitive protein RarD